VTAVDRCRAALDRGRAHAAETGVEVEFVEADMRDFTRPAAFDLAVSLFTSFGYLETVDEERRVVSRMRESLRPGGRLIVDVMGKEILARIFQDTRSEIAPDGTLMIWRSAAADDWTRISGQWLALREGRAKSFAVDHWIYSGRELRALLLEGGFRSVRLFGGFDGRPYAQDATRLIALARN
jgi:SAM-dependent methyltransferase